ncbi:hypothetical protein E2C01_055868 [Portunus trituberculatus]|uniref:Uncharacterized protein n=1 Tax=Portunus trituberculatus TaxID=210409 RepID=A0A5B7GSF1_PORTR|nr:hypothetical protein [Portunus trituberculatus]
MKHGVKNCEVCTRRGASTEERDTKTDRQRRSARQEDNTRQAAPRGSHNNGRYSQLVEVGAVGEEVVREVLQLVVVQTPATKRW